MTRRHGTDQRVLALDPTVRGVAFAVLEGPDRLIDWGLKQARRNKDAICLRRMEELLRWYEPTVLVIEDVHALGSRRGKRVTSLLEEISELSRKRGVGVRVIGRLDVLRAFSRDGRTSKDDVARAIATKFPELSSRLPDRRKAWEAEAERLGIFDAMAFGIAFYEGRFSA